MTTRTSLKTKLPPRNGAGTSTHAASRGVPREELLSAVAAHDPSGFKVLLMSPPVSHAEFVRLMRRDYRGSPARRR